jgi:hypothetical protein
MNAYYKIVGLTIACFIAGYFFWWEFFELSMNEIKSSRMTLNSPITSSLNSGEMIFAIAIGLIPLLHLGTVKLANISSTKQKVISLAILLISGLAVWQGRLLVVIIRNWRTNSILETTSPNVHFEYQLPELRPELFLLVGLLIGSIAITIILRTINR